jgi:hypothetical protein
MIHGFFIVSLMDGVEAGSRRRDRDDFLCLSMDASASIYLAGETDVVLCKTTCRPFNEMLDFGLMTFFFFFSLRLEYTEAVLMVLDPVLVAIKLIFY